MKYIFLFTIFCTIFAGFIYAEWQEEGLKGKFYDGRFMVFSFDYESAEEIGLKVRDVYNKVIEDIGYWGAFKNKYQILIWKNKEEFLKFLKKQNINISFESSAIALYNWKSMPTILGYYSQNFLTKFLPHEFTHLILSEALQIEGEKIPLWINEGLACFEEGGSIESLHKFLSKFIKQNNYIKLKELIYIKEYPTDTTKLQLFYAQSQSLVGFLINKRHKKDTFFSFLRWYVVKEYNFLQSYLYAYGEYVNLEEIEKQWIEYVCK
ncbi:MAG: hypothetical protein NC935_02005 [Candidatus Omnitrophica bacterium]|nr:hypothetical protein [Candidatus Omnitrophota bacterium]